MESGDFYNSGKEKQLLEKIDPFIRIQMTYWKKWKRNGEIASILLLTLPN